MPFFGLFGRSISETTPSHLNLRIYLDPSKTVKMSLNPQTETKTNPTETYVFFLFCFSLASYPRLARLVRVFSYRPLSTMSFQRYKHYHSACDCIFRSIIGSAQKVLEPRSPSPPSYLNPHPRVHCCFLTIFSSDA